MLARIIFALVAVTVGVFLIGYGAAYFLDPPWSTLAAAFLSFPLGYTAMDFILDES